MNTIIGATIGLFTIIGTFFTVDNRYAKQDQVEIIEEKIKVVDKRLDLKIMRDRGDYLQERIWKVEDRYFDKEIPQEQKDNVRRWQKEYDSIMKKISKSDG